MNRFYICVLIAFFAGLGTASLAKADKQAARVEIQTDQKSGAVHFVIGGKKVMDVDAAGLHVDGDVSYSGTITDTGTTHAQ